MRAAVRRRRCTSATTQACASRRTATGGCTADATAARCTSRKGSSRGCATADLRRTWSSVSTECVFLRAVGVAVCRHSLLTRFLLLRCECFATLELYRASCSTATACQPRRGPTLRGKRGGQQSWRARESCWPAETAQPRRRCSSSASPSRPRWRTQSSSRSRRKASPTSPCATNTAAPVLRPSCVSRVLRLFVCFIFWQAPYEADAQLAHLVRCSQADVVATEDGDLVVRRGSRTLNAASFV